MRSQIRTARWVLALAAATLCLRPCSRAFAGELSPAELCKLLTAEEVTQVLGAKRTSGPTR
jgi:hypothetical protein